MGYLGLDAQQTTGDVGGQEVLNGAKKKKKVLQIKDIRNNIRIQQGVSKTPREQSPKGDRHS